jgi:hypothetical protein
MADAVMKQFGRKAHNFIMRHPSQDKRYTFLIGAVRSSKTFALDAKTIVQLSRYEVAGKRLMTGATKQTLYRNVLLDLFNIVGTSNYSYNSSSGELWLFGKQWFCLGAKDEASYKQILGSTVGIAVADEIVEYPKSFMAQLFMRMSPDGARLYGSTNPGNPYVYLKAEVIDNKDFKNDLEVIQFRLHDNPNISTAAKAAIIASQSGVFKLRYIDGAWCVAEGAIYKDSWNELENLFDGEVVIDDRTVQLPPEPISLRNAGGFVDHWFSVDPGVDHIQEHLEFYDDGDTVWVVAEQRWDSRAEMRQKTDGQYADDLEAFGALGCEVRVPPEAASFRAELVMRGFWVVDADNAVTEGIHTVSTLLSKRKLRISKRGAPELAKRLPQYAWDDKAAKRGVEQPLKVEDDEADCLRYGIHGKIPIWRVTGL